MMTAVWFFYNYSVIANLKFLNLTANKSYHLILNLQKKSGCTFWIL